MLMCYIFVCRIGSLSASILLIGYYYGLLLRDINTDSLIGDLYSSGLISPHELNVILSGHSLHHRNWLLLDHFQHVDSQALLAFSQLVMEVWPHIGVKLVTGMCSCDCYGGYLVM